MQPPRPNQFFIVDDSAAIRARLAEMLGRMPEVAVVGEADSATAAVLGILRTRPDSVLLDLNLGGQSGIEVLRTIRKEAPEIVFVVLSNHAEPQYRRACANAGARYFLDKSTEFDRVREVIAQIVATPH